MFYERNESPEHRKVKNFLRNSISTRNVKHEDSFRWAVHTEKKVGDLRPDVHVELSNGVQVAVEYQKSLMLGDELRRKIQTYTANNVCINYIFGPDNHLRRINGNGLMRAISWNAEYVARIMGELYVAECNLERYGRTHIWRARIADWNLPSTLQEFMVMDPQGKARRANLECSTVRLSFEKLDDLVLQPEEVVSSTGEAIYIAKFQ